MSKKMMKRIVCNTVAALSAVACLGMTTACETAHPEVLMTIEFQDTPYQLEYELYRNVAPKTVAHFLWLAGNHYYDGLCVHNYDTSTKKMYTGAYSYDANEDTTLKYKEYYQVIAGYDNFASFPISVYKDAEGKNGLYTLYGEFGENGFEVENGAKKQSYGSLTMYYSDKTTSARAYVPYQGDEYKGQFATREYKYNSATSQFFISLSETETSSNKYCTFATLTEEGVEKLKELEEAIQTYIGADGTAEDFVNVEKINIDGDDEFANSKHVNVNVPKETITIKKIEVVKH